jgi:hypothetical protein
MDTEWSGQQVDEERTPLVVQLEADKDTLKRSVRALQARVDELENRKPEILDWEGKKVCICTPWYKDTNPATAICIAATLGRYGLEKIGWKYHFGDAMIVHSRGKVADKFLKSSAEWSFWVDDDIVFPIGMPSVTRELCHLPESYPDSLLNFHALERLLSHDKPLVGGVYFGRQSKGRAYFSEASADPSVNKLLKNPQYTPLLETKWVATGCMLVNRSVFEAIQKKFPELSPGEKQAADSYRWVTDYWDYFDAMEGRGEDVSFCARARECGIQPYVDTSVRAFHVGRQPWNWHNIQF